MQNSYKIILFLKWFFSLFQVSIWSIALFIGYEKVQALITFLAWIELKEDATDFLALKVLTLSEGLNLHGEKLIAGYLVFEWFTKLLLIYGIYKEKKSIFPLAFIIFTFLLTYELFLIFSGHSWYIIFLIMVDILLLWVIYKEYKNISSKNS
jgi:uncharacterized membrane protein